MTDGPHSQHDDLTIRLHLADRVREIRQDLYGEHGGPLLADALRLPFSTWIEYERGEPIPALILLRFLQHTRVDPHWLLTGAGSKYLGGHPPQGR